MMFRLRVNALLKIRIMEYSAFKELMYENTQKNADNYEKFSKRCGRIYRYVLKKGVNKHVQNKKMC